MIINAQWGSRARSFSCALLLAAGGAAAADVQERVAFFPGGRGRDYRRGISQFERSFTTQTAAVKNSANLPFLLAHGAKTSRTILMVHGFTDSPYLVRALASIYYDAGFNVLGLLLPGHGTRPEDLLAIRMEQWQQAVVDGLEIASHLGDEVAMAGFSTGGALILDATAKNAASQHPKRLRGLYLFSPAIAIADKQAEVICNIPPAQRPIGPWLNASAPEDNPYRYGKIAVNGICQVYRLTAENLRNRAAILSAIARNGSGVFTVQSQMDVTVSPEAVEGFMADLPSGVKSEFILYPKQAGIAHADVPRPESNPLYGELQERLRLFLSEPAGASQVARVASPRLTSGSLDFLRSLADTGRPF